MRAWLEEQSPDPVLVRPGSERAELSAEEFASPALHALGAATAWTDTEAGSGQEAAAKERRAPTSVHAKPGTGAAAARHAAAVGTPDQAPAYVEGGCETALLIKHLGLYITRDDEAFHGVRCRRKGSSYWRPRHFCSRSPAAAQKPQTTNYCSGINGPQEALPTRGE